MNSFVEARLFISNRGVVRVSHEALLRWGKARDWIEENREFLIVRERAPCRREPLARRRESLSSLNAKARCPSNSISFIDVLAFGQFLDRQGLHRFDKRGCLLGICLHEHSG